MPTMKTLVKDNMRSRDQRMAGGEILRETVPRRSHAGWKQPAKRRDPIDILEESLACPSVLEPYASKSPHENHGQRVVTVNG